MHNKSYKKAIVFALVLTMLMPLGSMAASSTADEVTGEVDAQAADTDTNDTNDDDAQGAEGTDDAEETDEDAEETDEDAEEKDDDSVEPITDEEAIALETCAQVADNANFILYADEENERICLYVKSSGTYWWSSPVNVMADETVIDSVKGTTMKKAQRDQISSSLAIKVGDLRQDKRTESPAPVYSSKASQKWKTEDKGIAVTYSYRSEGVKLTAHYELCEDNLYVYVDSSEIEEANTSTVDGKVTTKLQICPSFGAISATDVDGNPTEGYMIVPDGSGAVINLNNGKSNYQDYNQLVYGRDLTSVPLNAPRVTEQAYMPVLATVSGNKGFVAVVSDGDANVYANAQVSGQNKQAYNSSYFEFETRSQDAFFMTGDGSNKITVFEKGAIKTDRFGIRYYPIDKSEDINYADCAEVYRNYLINNKGLTSKVEEGTQQMGLSLYGGTMKMTSILGLPINLKTEMTGFSQAKEIVSKLEERGVSDFVVNYNNWTNDSIKNKISTDVKPSGTLGGKSDFDTLMNLDNVTTFPSMNNIQMDSGSWGYMTLTNTAIRISNAYSRQTDYSIAFGVQKTGVSPALLSPSTYTKVFDEMVDSYKGGSLKTIGFGDYSTKLVSDFSNKNTSSRNDTMNTIIEGYKKASENVGSILCDGANAYVLPYASQVTDVPVYSSGFNITDYDIPFYQMVIHGYVPYSTKAINASSNAGETFMLALAAGSALNYDMIYEESSEIKDTDFDDLYYSHYEGWLDLAAKQYEVSNKVLSSVSGMTISKYEISEDGKTITTTYSKDGKNVVVAVNKAAGTVSVDGTITDLADTVEGGFEG